MGGACQEYGFTKKKTLQEQGLLCIVYSFTAGTSVLSQKSNEEVLVS